MTVGRDQFQRVQVNKLDLIRLGIDESHTLLDLREESLAEIFKRYFTSFFDCVQSYKGSKEIAGYYYNPVKVSRIDLPGLAEDDARPLEAYDDLVGPPFWDPETNNAPAGEPQPPAG